MSRHLLQTHHGGWLRQKPDHRDYRFLPTVQTAKIEPVYACDIAGIPLINQARQGSCTGHGVAGVVMYDQKVQGEAIVVPSRGMIYYDARIPENTTNQDAGAEIRDAVGGVIKYGVCPDSEFPYNDQVFDVAPSPQNYASATKQEALVYEAVHYPNLNRALASGFPFVFGFTVYESFESKEVAATGIVPIPHSDERVLGGHCVWGWGYNASYTDDLTTRIPARTKACRNSWVNEDGSPWGDNGNFYLPQWYFDNGQCSDFWVIRRIGAR